MASLNSSASVARRDGPASRYNWSWIAAAFGLVSLIAIAANCKGTHPPRPRRRVPALLVVMLGFLVACFGYALGYLALYAELIRRAPVAWRSFGTWTDVGAVVPFLFVAVMFARARALAGKPMFGAVALEDPAA